MKKRDHIFAIPKRYRNSSKRDKNNNVRILAKRQKSNVDRYGNFETKNYNELFPIEKEDDILKRTYTAKESDSIRGPDMHSLLLQMSETIAFLTEKLSKLSEEIRYMQNNSILKIDSDEVPEEEILLLKKFETFELPISNRTCLENLENQLKHDQTFKFFFVRIH